jgi:hypothetical protein
MTIHGFVFVVVFGHRARARFTGAIDSEAVDRNEVGLNQEGVGIG